MPAKACRFFLLSVLLLGSWAPEARLSESRSPASVPNSPNPQMPLFAHPLLTECLEAQEGSDGNVEWRLRCPIEAFRAQAREANFKNPGLRLLMGDILRQQMTRLRADLRAQNLLPSIAPPRPLQLAPGLSELLPASEPEAQLEVKSELWLKDAQFWLKPLWSGGPGATYLGAEATLVYLRALAESLRFNEANLFLVEAAGFMRERWLQRKILDLAWKWIEEPGGEVLKPWLLAKLQAVRPNDIKEGGTREFEYWQRSLLLEGEARDNPSRELLAERLRKLWIAYPKQEEKIKALARKLGAERLARWPATKDMSVSELLIRARAEVLAVDSDAALRAMNEIPERPRKRLLPADRIDVAREELWEAFQFHVRVLRILDRRKEIPALIDRYVKLGSFLDIRKDERDLDRLFNRATTVARLLWNYGEHERAQEIVEKLLTLNSTLGTRYSQPFALYLKAKIAEQRDEESAVLPHVERALLERDLAPENHTELMWRQLYMNLDIAARTGKVSGLLPALESLRKIMKEPSEKSQWHYWSAQAQGLMGNVDNRKEQLRLAYKADPLSFYSDLAGLELKETGETPPDWKLKGVDLQVGHPWQSPDWSNFFDENGAVKDSGYTPLANAYFLAGIGWRDGAQRAFADADALLWDQLLQTKWSADKRRRYARALGWLRLAQLDQMGALRVAEVLRQAFGLDLDQEELWQLFPLPYWPTIQREAGERGLPPWMVASLIRQESAFNARARSLANAMGLMQMIPPVAKREASKASLRAFQVDDLYQPDIAIRLGTQHLAGLWKQYGNSWICAFAAYNAGSGPLEEWLGFYQGTQFPAAFIERISYAETRKYVKSILRNYINYQRIYGDGEVDLKALLQMPPIIPGRRVAALDNETP